MTRLKFNDEGKIYNSLKIIKEAPSIINSSGNKQTMVEVECLVCSKVKVVRWSKVKSGHTKSCGCVSIGRRKDITGERFGKLTVVSSLGEKSRGSFLWNCLCDCGNTKQVTVSVLNQGKVSSCGCEPRKGTPRDLTGQTFGRLTALEPVNKTKSGNYIWNCSCSCGNLHSAASSALVEGTTKSCGCYAKEISGKASLTHGMSRTPEYGAWKNAVARCTNPSNPNYYNYGGRGICVCERWLEPSPQGFLNFIEDMGESNGLTLERIQVNGNYSPDNCEWADRYNQSYNTRMHKTNTSGVTGVSKGRRGNWQSYINFQGKRIVLGEYKTFDQAVSARKAAEIEYYGKNK